MISVLTQYRVLKFIAMNVSLRERLVKLIFQCRDITQYLTASVQELGIGTYLADNPTKSKPYHPIATATKETTVFDVVHMFSEQGISAVPIVTENGVVTDLYETVDVIVRCPTPGLSTDDIRRSFGTAHTSHWISPLRKH